MKRKETHPNNTEMRVLDLIAEAGILKSVRRSGWWMIGMKNAESVAGHSFRAALLSFCIAKMEGVDPLAAVMMGLVNDLHESRINDLHKVGQRYIDFPAAERKSSKEQLSELPQQIGADLKRWVKDLQEQKTAESIVARDADILECMIQGKEYADQGHKQALDFMTGPAHLLKTKSARSLARRLPKWKSDRWWHHLVTLAR